jgi:hypothetical protein
LISTIDFRFAPITGDFTGPFLCSFSDPVDLSPTSPLSFPNPLPRVSRNCPCAATACPIQMCQYFLCLYEGFDLALMVFYFLVERNNNLSDFQAGPSCDLWRKIRISFKMPR